MMSPRVVEWIKRAILWIGATLLCLALIAILVFAKFRKDLGAAHETFRIGEILAPVAVGKAIKSGEGVGTFSLDEPIVGLATQLSVDELSTRTWRFRASPISTEPEMYSVILYEGNNATQFWSGAASAKSSEVKVIVEAE
jgi:hypothetical protein